MSIYRVLTKNNKGTMNFKHHFLLAMPCMSDNRFKNSLIYLCEHNDEGAMGFIINQPLDITVANMLDQMGIESNQEITQPFSLEQPLYFGGPVSEDSGFVLHKNTPLCTEKRCLSETLYISTSKEILTYLGTENEPERFMIVLGYAGWETGQLENELARNSWLTLEADPEIIFNTPSEERWEKALQLLGIDPIHLSSDIGHA